MGKAENKAEGRGISSKGSIQAGIQRKHTESLYFQSPFALIAHVSWQDGVEQISQARLRI